jgi:E3 ubiquitin-protein ligase SHPRH
LHAKAHSSGLNLVNATHVFLCEPLINTAIELQAIARVHRIGQHRETTVWMYLVSDTVEESIYDISVSRRLAHITRKQKEQEKNRQGPAGAGEVNISDLTETAIDAANSLELQDASFGNLMAGTAAEGERVDENDLWQCLFGKANRISLAPGTMETMQREVSRLLRAEAAESRRNVATPDGLTLDN